MARLPIITLPNPKLRNPSATVDPAALRTKTIQTLIADMIPTMYVSDGIGIAAPQVGHNVQICVVGKAALPKGKYAIDGIDPSQDLVLVNPTWEKTSRKTSWDTEGCLSVPKTYGKVKRFLHITVEALGRDGRTLSFDASHFFARVIQHEVDHLNGILFIDKAKDIYTVDKEEENQNENSTLTI
ncbi:MAG TPA: peptide deformylase [Candidatus Magasanikbacteria bacterium]|nr:MAG: peptide deformylase [Candidatus Magasanikbacteria bacterium RIFCSPLOWO2_02_FULL_47_16]OGH79892.1 MAG: peptide deformylase [Candidatus Magasanikbacteria bacterium RIFCSPHIGHO2_02_FULL_48_18]OGH81868.1 MAG: peptide deformylase [Candidatus Magasanikbacteria bacterium RIFCSPLOWO2_12_FULL_47_9b]HAZ28635.1 peptide deformylase [Candidatus Magasanikbacteria bacterium]